MGKTALRTVRFRSKEAAEIDAYLQTNTVFESFSSLARVATLSFISSACEIRLSPSFFPLGKKPSFLWDYDLNVFQVKEILSQRGLTKQKKWLLEKILTEAQFKEVFDYVTIDDISHYLPQLKLTERVRERWQYALNRWISHG